METKLTRKVFYSLSLRLFHPSINPDDITTLLTLNPDHAWKAGDQIKTPAGDLFNGVREQTYWCRSTYTEDNYFSAEINDLISYLAPHRDSLHRIKKEGGRTEIYLGLPGSINTGDTLPLETLTKLVDLKVELSIEIFPQMKRQQLS